MPVLKTKIIKHPTIGSISIKKNPRSKNLRITIKSPTDINVSIPSRASVQKALKFVEQKSDWIKSQQEKLTHLHSKAELYLKPAVDHSTAKKILAQRLLELANQYNFTINRIFVRNQKTRWGSCSAENNINLNRQLVRLPDHLMDYVLLHELVHTKVKSHSKQFWAELDKYVGHAKTLDKELKKYRLAFL